MKNKHITILLCSIIFLLNKTYFAAEVTQFNSNDNVTSIFFDRPTYGSAVAPRLYDEIKHLSLAQIVKSATLKTEFARFLSENNTEKIVTNFELLIKQKPNESTYLAVHGAGRYPMVTTKTLVKSRSGKEYTNITHNLLEEERFLEYFANLNDEQKREFSKTITGFMGQHKQIVPPSESWMKLVLGL